MTLIVKFPIDPKMFKMSRKKRIGQLFLMLTKKGKLASKIECLVTKRKELKAYIMFVQIR